jgi:shikimate dehydrogenase
MMLTIDGKTRLVGLMGWPVEHSLSPAMHNAAFAALGLDWAYVPLPVPPDRLGEAVRGLVALGFAGANVTVPHKEAVVPFLDRLTPAAQAIGAVNTILVGPGGELTGDNTDAAGFLADLRAEGVEPSGRRPLILGAGGAARAVAYALSQAGAELVAIAARNLAKAQRLADGLRAATGKAFLAARLPEDLPDLAREADLIVNATTVGMAPHQADASPWPQDVPLRPAWIIYDLVYVPAETLLLRRARAAGARGIGGLGMLVQQGAAAFRLWTGVEPPLAVMRQACEERLRDRE